jgi:voltage-gated potassium channel Kch
VLLVSIILIASPSYAFNTRITRTRTRKELTIPSLRLQSALMSSTKITDETETEATTIIDPSEPSEPPTPPPSKQPSKSSFRLLVFQTLNLPVVELAAAAAILLSTFLVALSTLDLPIETYAAIENAVVGLNVLFAVDFFLRWYAAGQFKLIYLTKPLAIIDIFVIVLPLFLGSVMPMLDQFGVSGDAQRNLALNLSDSAGLQVLLLLRVLRFRRVLTDINTFGRFAVALGIKRSDVRPYQLQLARVLLSIFTLLSVSSGLIYTAEHTVNPDIPDYFTALYFGLTTLTTVGFGDIVPVTFNGRLVVSGSILAGVAIIPAQAAKLADAIIASQKEEETVKRPMSIMGLTTSSYSKRKTTDGMGPSGVEIEVPPKEASTSGVSTSYKVCSQCRASGHRTDSSFCWSCGSKF